MDIFNLKKEAQLLKPVLQIGKKGMGESVLIEIEKLFKKRSLVKIKILNNCPIEDKHAMINLITERSQATLISVVGNVFTIYRKGHGKKPAGKEKIH